MAAKLYGTLVGQPYQNIVATGFGMIPNRYKDGTDQVLWRDTVALNGNLIGDQISLAILKSSAYIDQGNSFLWFGACGTGCTINIGDVNHANALGAALSVAAAGSASIEPAFVPGSASCRSPTSTSSRCGRRARRRSSCRSWIMRATGYSNGRGGSAR